MPTLVCLSELEASDCFAFNHIWGLDPISPSGGGGLQWGLIREEGLRTPPLGFQVWFPTCYYFQVCLFCHFSVKALESFVSVVARRTQKVVPDSQDAIFFSLKVKKQEQSLLLLTK